MPLLRGPYNARPPAGAAPHSGGRRRKRAGLELLLRNPLFFLIFAVRVSQKFCRATVALFNKIKYGNPEVMPAWRALRMATIEGAQAIGLGDSVGSLEPGKQADFIAIDLNCPSMLPVYTYPMRNMIPNLVYSARGPEVALVAVDGEIIMRDGVFTKVDQQEYLSAIPQYPDEIGHRAAEEFFQIDGTNARFMREGKL